MPAVPLYQTEAVRRQLGRSLRPGGGLLTRRILALTRPDLNWLVLDAGCGPGGGLELLRAHGLRHVLGVDLNRALLAEARDRQDGHYPHCRLLQADMARLPLAERTVGLILCECAWNLTAREQTLAEFERVLADGGMLAITDIFARTPAPANATERQAWPVPCCFAGATDLDTVRHQVASAGLTVIALEDHSRLLRDTAARFVFEHGSLRGFWEAVTGDAALAKQACRAAAAARPGLFLLLATRSTP